MSSEWNIVKITSLCDGIFDGPHATPKKISNGPVFLGISSLKNGQLDLSSLEYLSEDDFAKWTKRVVPKEGDIVFSYETRLGEAAIIPYGLRCCLGRRMALMRINRTKAIPDYVLYAYLSPEFQKIIRERTIHGSTVDRIPLTEFGSFPISIPPLHIQEEIVGILKILDDRINLLRETNTTLESIAQAIFKSWFVDLDPVRAKQEGRDPEGIDAETAALFPDRFEESESELGLIPNGWKICKVYDLAQYINGASYRAFEPNLERRGLPIIKIAELKGGITPQTGFSDINMPLKYKINAKDILFSWSGNPDTSIDTFIWNHDEAWLNQHIFRVVPFADKERSFVILALKYLKPIFAEIARNKQTTGLGRVTISDLKRLQIVKPSDLVLERWSELVDPLIEQDFIVSQRSQTLAEIRDTLLPRLISGQLRLPEAEDIVEDAIA